MALPTSRDVTLTPADPVPSALLNKLQDQVVGAKRPSFTRTFWPHLLSCSNGFEEVLYGTRPDILTRAEGVEPLTVAYFTIPFESGDRITGFAIETLAEGGTPSSVLNIEHASSMAGSHTPTLIGTWTVNHAEAWTLYQVSNFTPTLLGAGDMLLVTWGPSLGQTNLYFGPVRATFDRL